MTCEIERSETGIPQGQWDNQRDGDVSVMSDPNAHIGMTYMACQCDTREAAGCVAVGYQTVRHVERGNLALAEHGRSFGLASVYE